MRAFPAAAVVFLALSLVAVYGDEDIEKQKINKLNQLSRDHSGLARLDDHLMSSLVLSKHRNFHVFVLFNARDPSHNCDVCGYVEDELLVLSQSYIYMPHPVVDNSTGGEASIPQIFFARAEFQSNQNMFRTYGIKSVPLFAYFPPTYSSSQISSQQSKSIPDTNRFVATSTYEAEILANFVSDKTGLKIELYRSPYPRLILLICFLVLVYFIFKYASDLIFSVLSFIQGSKNLWIFIVLGIYFISVSGVMFDIIRGVPLFGITNTQSGGQALQFFHHSNGMQFGAEGFIVGGVCLLAGISLYYMSKQGFSSSSTTILDYFLPSSSSPGSNRVYLIAFSGFSFLFFCIQLLNIYRFKNQWYMKSVGMSME